MVLARDDLINVRQRRYLARDFDGLRAMLLSYAQQFYPDKLRDFSENSIGGLFLDLASAIGDNLSYYLDHQYSELDPTTAIENNNVERHLRSAGVPIVGAAPAIVPVTIFIQVPASTINNTVVPREDAIPIVLARTIFTADNGTQFVLLEDIDFRSTRSDGTLAAEVKVGNRTNTGVPSTFIMALHGLCISGQEATETVSVESTFVPFRRITLTNPNVSDVVSVTDGLGNEYHKVEALTHDVVYRNVLNTGRDSELVKDSMKVIPAPYRYTIETNISTRHMTLVFGGGNADTLEDDIIPDPSDFAISFPYSRTFSRIPINPQQLLQTKTLGVAATNTTLSIKYRYGGGLSHSVAAGAIQTVTSLKMNFPGNPPASIAGSVRSSVEVSNRIRAAGGEDAPTIDELKALIPAVKNSQERIVTREDMLARVYTLPSNFGRVFRASIRSNPNNPLATQLFIVSRDQQSRLITSPDTLKQNLVKYLNPYRMLSDAVDVLDARVINFTLTFDVLVDPTLNKSIVLQSILTKLQAFFNIKNFHIDQPLLTSDVNSIIFATPGVLSINTVQFQNIVGVVNNRVYSDNVYDMLANTRQGIVFPPGGGIFECRFPEVDIIGRASV